MVFTCCHSKANQKNNKTQQQKVGLPAKKKKNNEEPYAARAQSERRLDVGVDKSSLRLPVLIPFPKWLKYQILNILVVFMVILLCIRTLWIKPHVSHVSSSARAYCEKSVATGTTRVTFPLMTICPEASRPNWGQFDCFWKVPSVRTWGFYPLNLQLQHEGDFGVGHASRSLERGIATPVTLACVTGALAPRLVEVARLPLQARLLKGLQQPLRKGSRHGVA